MDPLIMVLVLLGTYSAATVIDDNVDNIAATSNVAVDGKEDALFEIQRSNMGAKRLSQLNRRKRAFSPFQRAWKAILKTVYGSRTLLFEGKYIKLYAKVGATDDALKDFITLNPTSVIQDAVGMRGQVGNQVIELRILSPSGNQPPSLFVFDGTEASNVPGVPSKRVLRAIYYFEKSEQAKFIIE